MQHMICQECKGARYKQYVATEQNPYHLSPTEVVTAGVFDVPCPRCGGTGVESCCDGEDRWQTDKLCTCEPQAIAPDCPLHGEHAKA